MEANEMKKHIDLLNVRLTCSINTLVDAFDESYKFFKEKKPNGTIDSYYAAVLSSFANVVFEKFRRDGEAAAATSAPIMVAAALIKYLSEHPEFKSNLMF